MVEIKIKMDELKIELPLFKPEEIQRFAERQLQDTRARLTRNIQSGRDADGKAMRPYSPSYKKKIAKARSGQAGGVRGGTLKQGPRKVSEKVNLTVTGQMLRSRTTRKTLNGGELVFTGSHSNSKLSNEQLASVQLSMRPDWHSLGEEDLKRIETELKKLLGEKLEKIIKVTRKT